MTLNNMMTEKEYKATEFYAATKCEYGQYLILKSLNDLDSRLDKINDKLDVLTPAGLRKVITDALDGFDSEKINEFAEKIIGSLDIGELQDLSGVLKDSIANLKI